MILNSNKLFVGGFLDRLFFNLKLVVSYILIPLFFTGCFSKQQKIHTAMGESIVERSANKRPSWVTVPKTEDKIYMYFSGVRTSAESFEAGERDATNQAVKKIIDYLGLKGESKYESLRTEESTRIQDSLKLEGKAEVAGIKLLQTYYEKKEIRNKEGISYKYDIFILLRYPVADIDRVRKLKEFNTKSEAKVALNLYLDALKKREQGNLKDAVSLLNRSRKHLLKLESIYEYNNPEVGSSARLEELIKSELSSLTKQILKLSLLVIETVNNKPSQSDYFGSVLRNSLTDNGFVLDSINSNSISSKNFDINSEEIIKKIQTKSTFLVLANASAVSSGEYLGLKIVRLSIRLKVINSETGVILMDRTYEVKDGASTVDKAARLALSKASRKPAKKFAVELSDLIGL